MRPQNKKRPNPRGSAFSSQETLIGSLSDHSPRQSQFIPENDPFLKDQLSGRSSSPVPSEASITGTSLKRGSKTYLGTPQHRSRFETFRSERKKEIYSGSKTNAIGNFALFHLPAVAVTIVLLILYLKRVQWTPPHPTAEELGALQFAAKAHEALVLISLTDILLQQLRYGLVIDDGVPLGFISSAFVLASPIQYLFSWEFWGTVWNPTTNRRFHSLLTGSILLLALLGIAAGPFSAIIMIPRQRWWEQKEQAERREHEAIPIYYVEGDRFVKTPLTSQFDIDRGNFSVDRLIHTMIPSLIDVPQVPETDNISITADGTAYKVRPVTLSTINDYGLATSPMGFVAQTLYDEVLETIDVQSKKAQNIPSAIRARPKKAYTESHVKKFPQPLVMVRCEPGVQVGQPAQGGFSFTFTDIFWNDAPFTVNVDTSSGVKVLDSPSSANRLGPVAPSILDMEDNSLSLVNTTNAAISISGGILFQDRPVLPTDDGGIRVCLIWAFWVPAETWIAPPNAHVAQTELGVPSRDLVSYLSTATSRGNKIQLTMDWLVNGGLNDALSTHDSSDTNLPSRSNKVYGDFSSFCTNTDLPVSDACLPLLLAYYVTDRLSGPSHIQKYYPNYSEKYPGPNDTLIDADHYVYLYAYSFTDSRTIPLAFSVLLLHVFIVAQQAVFLLASPNAWRSSAWGSFGQLMALALRSRAPHELENVGGGVTSAEIWKVPVSIRDCPHEKRLEMVLEDRTAEGECVQRVEQGRVGFSKRRFTRRIRPGREYS